MINGHGSLVNGLTGIGTDKPTVGMGATELLYSDRAPFTVVGIVGPKTIRVQADDFQRADKNGESESQVYTFTPNLAGEIVTLRLTKRGWMSKGRRFTVGKRDAFYDFTR